LLLASLPPGFPQNPNVLLIRTHPNPFPSVGYNYCFFNKIKQKCSAVFLPVNSLQCTLGRYWQISW
jgi:hypothetical protein